MATDHELITGICRITSRVTIDIADVCGDLASAVVRLASYRQCLHLVRTGDGWKRANPPWLPQ